MVETKGNDFSLYDRLREQARAGQVVRVVTHVKPHLDEITALLLLWSFGRGDLFPNQTLDQVVDGLSFWGHGGRTPDGRPWAEHVQEGEVLLGCAHGSSFDEHAAFGQQHKAEDACASLVARWLGVRDHPAWSGLLDYVVGNDLKGGASQESLPAIIRRAYQGGASVQSVFRRVASLLQDWAEVSERFVGQSLPAPDRDWVQWVGDSIRADQALRPWRRHLKVFLGLLTKHQDPAQYPDGLVACLFRSQLLGRDMPAMARYLCQVFKHWAQDREALWQTGQDILSRRKQLVKRLPVNGMLVMVVEEESPRVGSVVFNGIAGKPAMDMLIHRHPMTGHTRVMLNKRTLGLCPEFLRDLVTILCVRLRREEVDQAYLAGRFDQRRYWELGAQVLEQEGGLLPLELSHWYWDARFMALFNGSETAPDLPPSQLSLKRIVQIIKEVFSELRVNRGAVVS